MSSYAWDTRTFNIKQSNEEDYVEGFTNIDFVLTVRLDIPGSPEFGVHDVTAWLRKRNSLISVAPGPHVSFLQRLPSELRDLIYGFCALPEGGHFGCYHVHKRHWYFDPSARDFVNLLLVNRQMSAELTDFVCRTGAFSLSLTRDRDGTCAFLEDIAWFVQRMPAYIVSGIREIELKSELLHNSRTTLTYVSPLMPLVSTIGSYLGKTQKPCTQAPVFNLDEVALFHEDWRPKQWLSFTFVTSNIEPRIKFVLESTLQEADWPSVFSSIHPREICAKQCKKHQLSWGQDCDRGVVTNWQSSPVLKKVVESIVQSIQLNVVGYASELDDTYSVVKQSRFEFSSKHNHMPSGYFPMARFRPRPRKEVDSSDSIPLVSDKVARSHPYNWGPWPSASSEVSDYDSDDSSVVSFRELC
ncbi:hypothetical protein MMC32_001541 [Xylographa parallela]|nr:hypothetical protein [Xylographa parallela]